MDLFIRPFAIAIWFFYQALIVGGLGVVFFLVPFTVLVATLIFSFPRNDRGVQRRLFGLLVSLPAIWLFVALWGGLFWLQWPQPSARNPDWVQFPVIAGPVIMLLAAGFFNLACERRAVVCCSVRADQCLFHCRDFVHERNGSHGQLALNNRAGAATTANLIHLY